MEQSSKRILGTILRYALLVLIALPGFDIFYYIFLPLTLYPVYGFMSLFFHPLLVGNAIFIGEKSIEIVGACVAGSAYYLLLILNLATPGIKFRTRVYSLLTGFGIFLFVNILRIIILGLMYLGDSPLFEFTHKLFWYLGSTVFIVAIWFFQVFVFRIKKIPFYSDLKYLHNKSSLAWKKSPSN